MKRKYARKEPDMSIKIYNTLSRQKEMFTPIEEQKVRMYVCGPTVYNYIHIGNARSTVAFDTIRRYLEFKGYDVNYVSNFTDVDDKIIQAAKEEGLTPKELADKYIQAFKEDTGALNVKPATLHPRVQENMTEIISFVDQLIQKGYAYESQGDVYFRANKFEEYGALSGQSLEHLRAGASERVDEAVTERKEDPLDFTLWKKVTDSSEISWDSPWSKGRPGWHIECSVMATKYLGNTLDIHGGGQDLEFPHHENEIAQSEACTNEVFANYWMHNGFVTLGKDEEKMSKSLGNFILLRDLLSELDPMIIRYLLATVHYRRPLKYDEEAVNNATTNLARLKEVSRRLTIRLEGANEIKESTHIETLDHLTEQFIQAMDDDFNAANGMKVVFDLVRYINHYLEQEEVSSITLQEMKKRLTQLLEVFGIILQDQEGLDEEIEALIKERTLARQEKDYARGDEIRQQLLEMGIQLDDTPRGTEWKRV